MLPFVVLTLAALFALLVAEARGAEAARWIAKPLASTGFVGAAVAAGALSSGAGRVVLAALVLCWLGDVLLIPRGGPAFRAGLASFLLGHVAFVVAFLLRGASAAPTALAAAALAPAAWLALRWLHPHVPASLRAPVLAYVVVISLMVACAAGTWPSAGVVPLVGALLFYVSDLAVARDRFVAHGFANRAWGLPLYYTATLVLASTAGGA